MEKVSLDQQLEYFLNGGFAQTIDLLREFDYDKSGIVLVGLHFSAFSLLKHMDARQEQLLQFLKDPCSIDDLWPDG